MNSVLSKAASSSRAQQQQQQNNLDWLSLYCVGRVRLADNCSQHCAVWLCSKTKLRKVANEARHLAVRLLYHSILCVKKKATPSIWRKIFRSVLRFESSVYWNDTWLDLWRLNSIWPPPTKQKRIISTCKRHLASIRVLLQITNARHEVIKRIICYFCRCFGVYRRICQIRIHMERIRMGMVRNTRDKGMT